MFNRSLLIAGTGAICLAVACGVASLTADTACNDQAVAQCNLQGGCWSGEEPLRSYGALTTCIDRVSAGCLIGLAAPGTGATPTTVDACAKADTTENCSDYFNGNSPTACLPLVGKIVNGAGCAYNSQCESTFCSLPPNQICGECAAPTAIGDDCTHQACATGQTCTLGYDGVTKTCQRVVGVTASCSQVQPCAADLTCVGDETDGGGGAMGTCQAQQVIEGSQCDSKAELLPTCDSHHNLYCTARQRESDGGVLLGTCVIGQYVSAGSVCGAQTDGGPDQLCEAGGQCVNDAGTRTCVAPAADQMPCDAVLGPPCLSPARCVVPVNDAGITAGVCELKDPQNCQ